MASSDVYGHREVAWMDREEGSGHGRVSRELCFSRQGQACILLGLSVDQSHISQSADKPSSSDQSHVSFTAQQTSSLSL